VGASVWLKMLKVPKSAADWSRVQKNPGFFFKKKAQPSGFLGLYWVFLDKQEKIGKIIEKLSNLKP